MARNSSGGRQPGDNQNDYGLPQRPRPDITQMMTLSGTIVLLMISFGNWREIDRIQESLDSRLGKIETQISQVGSRAPAPAPARRQPGPDPDRVYSVKLDNAPIKGLADAAITITEFSDFQ